LEHFLTTLINEALNSFAYEYQQQSAGRKFKGFSIKINKLN